MSDAPEPKERLGAGFLPGGTWVAAMEVPSVAPGDSIRFDPDTKAYPQAFSKAKPGDYQFMALLDPDHSYARDGQNEGDLYSEVVPAKMLDPASADSIRLSLTKVAKPRQKFEETATLKLVEMESRLLSTFWGRPVAIRAIVALPDSYAGEPNRWYPACYDVHGFGGNHLYGARQSGGSAPEGLIRVYLDGSFSTGHHVFADSVNNGPWGRALTEEFIPYLEKRFRLVPHPNGRFLTGHSSGGWSTLWLQVTYPEFFGGTWSTAPDPVDLRSFTGFDVTPGSADNAYRTADGKARNLARKDGKELVSIEEFARQEEVLGEYGGQFASFEWVWSPRGTDGRPMKLFNRVTGEQDLIVQRAWRKYDIRFVLAENWSRLGPKLKGKLHIVYGAQDTFHLEEAADYLCDFLKSKGREDACEVVPERDHMNLYRSYTTYPDGLGKRITSEMLAAFAASNPPK